MFAIDLAQDLGKRLVPTATGIDLCVAARRKLDPDTVVLMGWVLIRDRAVGTCTLRKNRRVDYFLDKVMKI